MPMDVFARAHLESVLEKLGRGVPGDGLRALAAVGQSEGAAARHALAVEHLHLIHPSRLGVVGTRALTVHSIRKEGKQLEFQPCKGDT